MQFGKRQLQIAAAIVVILALAGGGFWLAKRNKPAQESVNPEITLQPDQQIQTQLTPPMTNEEKKAIDDAFAKEGAEMTMIKDVSGGQGVGTAWRNWDGSKFYFKVAASKLIDSEKGFYYEGWLVGPDGFFSAGRMAVVGGQGILYYSAAEDKTAFRGVVVTLEPEDGNPTPAKHILEGSF